MTLHDLYLISPQLALAVLGILVIVLDLCVHRKGLVQSLAIIGLAAPAALGLLHFYNLEQSGLANLVPAASVLANSFAVDRFSLFFGLLVLIAAAVVFLSASDYLDRPESSVPGAAGLGSGSPTPGSGMDRHQGEFFGLVLFAATGMTLLVGATELITIYIALELTTLPLAALGAFLLTPKSSEAGMKFLIVGAISSAVMLYGMALIFGASGSTTLEGIAAAVSGPSGANLPFGSYAMLLGVALVVVGFGFKLSAVPFQMWVPDVYEGAPTPVVAFLSVASKAAAFGLALRFFYQALPGADLEWGVLLAILAAASMIVGNLVAIAQSNIKRLLGYSTIAHAGYILIGVAAVAQDPDAAGLAAIGPSSVLFYLGAYTAANLTAFGAVTVIGSRIDSDRIDDYAGMVRRSPFLAIALALALIALIGVPPTSVFIAKIYVFTAAFNGGLAWLVVLGVINSVVSAYYYLRVLRVMFLQEPPAPMEKIPTSAASKVSLVVVGAAVIWLGVAPGLALNAAETAVAALVGGFPP